MECPSDSGTNLTESPVKWMWVPICMLLFVPLVWLRKTEKLAFTHIFADIMVGVGLIMITVFATIEMNKNGGAHSIPFVTSSFSFAISYAVFAFEGIGVVLPILELTENKDQYFKLLTVTLCVICTIFIAFCEYAAFGYGSNAHALILQNLPQNSWIAWLVAVLYSLVVVFTYPLQIGPANYVLESYLFNGWEKSAKRKWCKNLSRTLVVFASCVLTISMYEFISELLEIASALTAIPMAFTLPSLFHLGKVADSCFSKFIDILFIVCSILISLFCAYEGTVTFLNKLNGSE